MDWVHVLEAEGLWVWQRGTEDVTNVGATLEMHLWFCKSLNKEVSKLAANVLWFLLPPW